MKNRGLHIHAIRVPCLVLLALSLAAQDGHFDQVIDKNTQATESKLKRRIEWEILWDHTRTALPVRPQIASYRIAIHRTGDDLYYCSEDLGECGQYRVENLQLTQKIRKIACSRDPEVALAEFLRQDSQPSMPRRTVRGSFDLDNPIRTTEPRAIAWSAQLGIRSRAEILRTYRKLRPDKLDSLRKWLSSDSKKAYYSSFAVPCFDVSDPLIYVYGERRRDGPIVFSIFWNEELEDWTVAGLLERPDERELIGAFRSIIQAIQCSTIRFR